MTYLVLIELSFSIWQSGIISVANFITFDSEGHVSWHLYTRDCDPISMLRHTEISYNVLEEVFRLSHDLEKNPVLLVFWRRRCFFEKVGT